MLSVGETLKIALRLPYAKFYAAGAVLGPIAAILVAWLVESKTLSTALLMVIVFPTTILVDRFGACIRAVRAEDLKRNGYQSGYKASAREGSKKKKKKH